MPKLLSLLVLALIAQFALLAQPETYREAYDRGFSDGRAAGDADRSAHHPFDFANKAHYQEGLRGFEAESHQRDVYQVAYRRGFEDGYEMGYGLRGANPPEPPVASSMRPVTDTPPAGRGLVPEGSELLVRLTESLTTQRNQSGDPFHAEVVRALEIEGQVLIPVGSRVHGTVTHSKRPGRVRGRAEMTLSFEEVALPNGASVPIRGTVASVEPRRSDGVESSAGTIQASGEKGDDLKKVGASAGIGALIGILAGGGGGARAGAAIGAATGAAGVLATRGSDLLLPAETELMMRFERDVTIPTGILRPEPQP
jgi:hypothetical protein